MPDVLVNVLNGLWGTLAEMSPYLLFGFFVAGVLSVFISPQTVERHLGKGKFLPVVKAALFGVPLPLCSCGVIPVAASLRKHGANRGATTAFLLSTPQTGVDSIMVTLGLLGPVFAVFRAIAAFVTGLLGGWVVSIAAPDGQSATDVSEPCTDECCAGTGGSKAVSAMRFGFVTLPRDIAKPLIIGLIVAGVISGLVPEGFFAEYLGGSGSGAKIGSMFVMMLIGMPLYVCATASVPMALALIMKGVSPGAALVFLITGPATNAAAFTTLSKVLGRRSTIIYLITVAASALLAGLLLDGIIEPKEMKDHIEHAHGMLPEWVKLLSVVGLCVLLVSALLPRKEAGGHEHDGEADHGDERGCHEHESGQAGTVQLDIEGMTCNHCVQSVREALRLCDGVNEVHVQLEPGLATVTGGKMDPVELIEAVGSLRYKAVETTKEKTDDEG